MKILTASEMQRIDRLTTERYGVPSLTLMENAGRGVVEFLAGALGPLHRARIVILCGKGNNGGDGLVVARLLREQGFQPARAAVCRPRRICAETPRRITRACSPPARRKSLRTPRRGKPSRPPLPTQPCLSMRCWGPDFAKPLEGYLLEVVRDINTRFPAARVLAVDLPSGISADSGELIGEHMRADFSVTFTAPKIAHVFPPACERMGEWVVQPDWNSRSKPWRVIPSLYLELC